MNILVTGGAGFIGANFIEYMLKKYDYNIVNLDELTYAGNLNSLKQIETFPHYKFVKGNICNSLLVQKIIEENKINIIINFAAESHVDRSIDSPNQFINTNIIGTHTLLEEAKNYWKLEPSNRYSIEYKNDVKFIQVSTDEVYGELDSKGLFTEKTPLAPNSPYSASKASADLLVRSYYETFGLPINITRCSNNYGPYQFPEKLIPLTITEALKNNEIPIYGNGTQVRDWLYVKDHCIAIDAVLHRGTIGDTYNIGGNNEKQNIEIVKYILNYLNKSSKLIKYVKDRPGHDKRYAIDNSKISNELKWEPIYTFEDSINYTIKWYLGNPDWIEKTNAKEFQFYNDIT